MAYDRINRRDALKTGAWLGIGSAAPIALSGPARADDSDPGVIPLARPLQMPQTEGLAEMGDGHALWYFDTGGDGPPVIFLHPGSGSGKVWAYQQPVFAKAGFRMIGYSRRGRQGSRMGDPEKAGTGAGDLLKLADHLRLKKFHLVATAAGGMVAADFAATGTDRIGAMVLASTVMGVTEPEYRAVQARLYPPGFSSLPTEFRELGPSYRHLDPEGMAEWIRLERNAKSGEMKSQSSLNQLTWRHLEAWKMPVLVMTGDADLYMPPSVMRLFHRHIPGAEKHIIPDSGHSGYWERPKLFNSLTLDFLKRHSTA